jgi:hypothetical protein
MPDVAGRSLRQEHTIVGARQRATSHIKAGNDTS